MTGVLKVRASHPPEGGAKQVLTILPNNARFYLPAESALTYAFAILTVAKTLFPDIDALNAAVPIAADRVDEMLIRSRGDLQ